ncbi:histidine kinase [Geodermatophilus sp. SYSU D00815]
MRLRRLGSAAAVAAVLSCAAATALSAWVDARMADAPTVPFGGVWAVLTATVGALLVHRRPGNAVGWLIVLAAVLQAGSVGTGAYGGYGVDVAEPDWPLAPVVAQAGSMLWLPSLLVPATLLVAVYPTGRLGPRWSRWAFWAAAAGLAVVTVGGSLGQEAYDDVASGPAPVDLPANAVTAVVLGAGVAAFVAGSAAIWVGVVVRLLRARAPERQQLAWLAFVVLLLVAAIFLVPVPDWLFGVHMLLVPFAVAVGMVRYRLLGVVVTRGLVYGVLTGAVLLAWLAVAAVAAAALGRSLSPVPGTVAAALVAVALSPARSRLQVAADRLVYGERRDPVAAVARLGDRVAAVDEADLLPAVLETVTAALRAPGAAVLDPEGRTAATTGRPVTDDAVRLPLRVGGRDVGTLAVARRGGGEPFTGGDERLLAALTPQVAAVVRALELADSLERERDRVLTATHAERDRIRRDLHDGLGPSLAGISLGVQALQAQQAASPLLGRLREEVDSAVGEVRRIIDGLRPAALDDVGLVPAIERHAQAVSASVPVQVRADALPPLPPDVETAALRIAQEALTNVARHSGARCAEVGVRARAGRLELTVSDDGGGLPGDGGRPDGVGLASMRTRARAVGGDLTVTSGPGGTRVVAALPVGTP